MSAYVPGYLVKEIRERKILRQTLVASSNEPYTVANLSRVEKGIQKPQYDTVYKLINSMGLSPTTIFYPWLENQTISQINIRDRINYLLDIASPISCKEAMQLVAEIENEKGFNQSINLQFIISCKAQLNELMHGDVSHTIALVKEGISLTYKEFDESTFDGSMLIFEESTLLYTLAHAYNRMGKREDAIKLLQCIWTGIEKLPEDDHEKEKKLAKVLLTLSDFLIQAGRYEEALNICQIGNITSIKRNKGKYTPPFLYNEAVCKFRLGLTEQCRLLLQLAYFGFILLRKLEKAKLVLKNAHQQFGIQFKTYGTENLTNIDFNPVFARGEPISCDKIGDLIEILRKKANMTQAELSEGICRRDKLARMESGELEINTYNAESFMQRLGRDVNQYFHTFLTVDEFNNKQMRDEINSRLVNLDYNEAEELLQTLKTKKSYQKGANLQFVMLSEASIFKNKNGSANSEYFDRLVNAIKITKPKFDEKKVASYRLTYYEILLINGMAIHYCTSGKLSYGISLFERLRDSINESYVDEIEKIRTYPLVLYNMSKYLSAANRYEEALELVDEGELLGVKHGRLNLLHNFAANRCYCLRELDKIEESVPYLALAYYGSIIMGESNNQLKTAQYAKERFGIEFD